MRLCVLIALLSASGCGLVLDLEPRLAKTAKRDGGRDDGDAGTSVDGGQLPRDAAGLDAGGRAGGSSDAGGSDTGADASRCEAAMADSVVLEAADALSGSTCTRVDTVDLGCWGTSGTEEAHYLVEARDGSVVLELEPLGVASFATVDPSDCTSVIECGLTRLVIDAGEIVHLVVEYDPPSGRCGAFEIFVAPAL